MTLDLFELAEILNDNNKKMQGKFYKLNFNEFLFNFINENINL
jgi:hypothetical protein